jgi:LDH2 family malate/lactate/ureidoglycolate dehydrogenase
MMLRYQATDLVAFADALFTAAGLATSHAAPVAHYLVEADLMGHDTHGLALAAWYLGHVGDGTVARDGDPETISDKGAAVAWAGQRLPGAYLVTRALDLAVDRARTFGTCTVNIGNAHHIGALAAYLHRATDHGMLVSIASSSPSGAQVAPYGGLKGVFTPNPVAHGIPTPQGPVLIDISASITTFNMAQRLIREGRTYPGDWVMTPDGTPSADPADLTRGGTLLPTGGLDHGQKGYGLALQVEALTQGLAGYGRADAPKGTNSAVTVQVWDPAAFGGADAFLRQTGWLSDACHASPPRDPGRPVRLPGEAALARKARALAEGVALYPSIMPPLVELAKQLGVIPPAPLNVAKVR